MDLTTIRAGESLRTANQAFIYEFLLTSLAAASTSDEISIPIGKEGQIQQVKIVSETSIDFDISLRSKKSITPPDINEVLNVENINLEYSESNLGIYYSNNESVEVSELYLVLTNTDGAHATGEVQFEIVVHRM